MRTSNAWLPVVAALAMLGGCASTPEVQPPMLPFHVALIPVQTIRRDRNSEEGQRFELTQDAASAALRAALEQIGGFTTVTLLPKPEDGLNPAALDAHWVAKAREVRADLLLECRLEYTTDFQGERNEKFWLNLPLFLLGGPMCYWVNDRTYKASAELTGDLYDLSLVYRELYPLGSARVRLISVASTFGDTTMDFTDRADGAGQYGLSIVWPAGMLSKSNDKVTEKLEEAIITDLSGDFSARLAVRRRDIVEADGMVNFWFEPDPDNVPAQASIKRGQIPWVDPETREVSGMVLLRVDENVRRMTRWRVGAPGQLTQATWHAFPDPPPEAQLANVRGREHLVIQYPLQQPVEGDAVVVCLELEDGHENRFTRSYTIPIPASDDSLYEKKPTRASDRSPTRSARSSGPRE